MMHYIPIIVMTMVMATVVVACIAPRIVLCGTLGIMGFCAVVVASSFLPAILHTVGESGFISTLAQNWLPVGLLFVIGVVNICVALYSPALGAFFDSREPESFQRVERRIENLLRSSHTTAGRLETA